MTIHVLLIESDTERVRAVCQLLARARLTWQIEVVPTLQQAHERRLAGALFDVALIGFSLTDSLGNDAVELARSLPTVLCVSPGDEWASARALRLGFSSFIHCGGAGAEFDTLVDMMEGALARWEDQRQKQETARRYELVLAGSDLVAWERFLPSGDVYPSDRLFAMLGYGIAERRLYSSTKGLLDAELWQRLVHRDDWAMVKEASDAYLRGDTPSYRCEYRLRHKDGHWIWVLSRGRVMERDADGTPMRMLGTFADITKRRGDQDAAARQNRLLQAISRAQALVIASSAVGAIFDGLLDELLSLTGSHYGFVGEVFFDAEQQPYLKTFAISNIAWDDTSRRRFEESMPDGMLFSNPKTLFGAALTGGEPVIANQPATDSRRGGLPAGHPTLDAFLGLPIHHGDDLVAMVGLANKSGGYSLADVEFLDPLCKTIGQMVQARRIDAQRQRAQEELAATAALLAEKTQSLKTTLDSMSQGIVTLDSSGRFTVYNQRVLELLDLPESLLAARPNYMDVVNFQALRGDYGDDNESAQIAQQSFVLGAGTSSDAPRKHLRITRAGRAIEVVTRVLPSGEMVRVYSDITEQRQADAKLRDSEARFRGLTALSSDWYWQQDENYRFVEFEGSVEQSGRRAVLYATGKFRWEIPTYNMSEPQWQAHRAVLDARLVFRDLELERRTPAGAVQWVSVSGEPIFDVHGAFCGYRGIGRDITARKQAEAQIEKLAFYDSLTELPNRRMLLAQLAKAIDTSARKRTHGGLLFIDLDNFKTINDTMGHLKGDQLLQQVARRLNQCVRPVDTVARFGGDEFVVLLEDLSQDEAEATDQAETLSKKILFALNQHFVLAGQQQYTSPSVGITMFFGSDETVDDLLKRADMAMYQAKAAGRNTIRFFDPEMQAIVIARAELEVDLRHGLTQGELHLCFQPVVSAAGRMTGVEALARWLHPVHGLVLPTDFIPMAEKSGLILPLGQWVLETACAQLVSWSNSSSTQGLTIAVNVSAHEFRHPDFASQVLALLRKTGANPYRLKLELTESLLLNDVEDAIIKMSELRSIGVSFSLDDFGTGYSSLSYLKRLPLDQLKIDQSFVRDVLTDANDAAIVRTILSLAHSLDLTVVAEGVETQGQLELLKRWGCQAFQGYLFGVPLPINELNLT
jgi:diguanylate cyclase (GGDEF)-like protein/PAS domain S-box-containing protein